MPVELKGEDQELLAFEVAAYLDALPEGARGEYAALAEAVGAGSLPDDVVEPAGRLLEAGLQTGRVRKLHRANGEQALLRLFGKTPAGQARGEQIGDVNRALAELAGQEIESVRVLARVPGSYLLQIGTDDCEITLRFGPEGAAVESVALGI
jgi:hypothetical protein